MSVSIKALVDRGLSIRKELAALKTELEGIEDKLSKKGLYSDQVPLVDDDREGRRYLAKGSELIVPVLFTADKIKASFKADSPAHKEILAASNGHLGSFYHPVRAYETLFDDGKKFRARADEVLGKDLAPQFITACLARDKHGIPKSDIKIMWDDSEPVVAKEAA